jgi:hypothetical protein
VLTPSAVAAREHIFWFGDWFSAARSGVPRTRLGVPLHTVCFTSEQVTQLIQSYGQHNYLLSYVPATQKLTSPHSKCLCVVWHVKASARDVLSALFQVQLIRNGAPATSHLHTPLKRWAEVGAEPHAVAAHMQQSLAAVSGATFDTFLSGLEQAGWDTQTLRIDTGEWRVEYGLSRRDA